MNTDDKTPKSPTGDGRATPAEESPRSGEGADTALKALIRKRKLQGDLVDPPDPAPPTPPIP